MKKEIMYQENAPEKKYLWLHYKNNNMTLEVFGNKGWESVGDDSEIEELHNLTSKVSKLEKVNTSKEEPIKVELPKLDKECSKQELLDTINSVVKALSKAGIIKITYK